MSCFLLASRADSRALDMEESTTLESGEIIEITTSSSISVKPFFTRYSLNLFCILLVLQLYNTKTEGSILMH